MRNWGEVKDQGQDGLEELTHTPEELLARYHKAMRGHPVAALEIDEYSPQKIVVRARFEFEHTRPGRMVLGPNLFLLADATAYFVTISRSPKGSEAFTASLSMEFLKPAPIGVLFAEGRLLRFGRRSCVVDTLIRLAEPAEPIAHAVVTYAPVFPDNRQA
jgi:acyl-coenzyme A thioesterase PaaI-like protein